jgi:hypothetical protein
MLERASPFLNVKQSSAKMRIGWLSLRLNSIQKPLDNPRGTLQRRPPEAKVLEDQGVF